MTYQVLARKWRPKSFATLVGQEHVVKALSNALSTQRLHHAYLLTGTRGVGKTTIARILAKSLNCETGITAEPCGVCDACRQIDAGRFVDLLEIDAASNTGIDNIREVLDNAQYSPTQGRFKVYIIDEVHMLSKNAFNAMLKTLEEPPGHVKFILATTDPQKVPVTILSRCLQFSLRQMLPAQIGAHLHDVLTAESVVHETAALILLGHAAAGSMRDALSLLDQAIAYGGGSVTEAGVHAMLGAVDQSYLRDLLAALSNTDGPGLMQGAATLAERGVSADAALQTLASLLQQIALAQTVPDAIAADHPDATSIRHFADCFTPEDVQLYYQIALHGRRDLALAPDEFAGLSMTLLRMLAFKPARHQVVSPNKQDTAAPAASPSPKATAHSEAPVAIPLVEPAAPVREVMIETAPVVHAAPEAAAPTAPAPIPNAEPITFNGDWASLVAQLKLGGQAGMLAQHADLIAFRDQHIQLAVPDAHRVVAGPDYRDKLEQALRHQLGVDIRLSITVGGAADATPAAQQQRERQARLSDATDAINSDPFVHAVIANFDATVVPDSIQARAGNDTTPNH